MSTSLTHNMEQPEKDWVRTRACRELSSLLTREEEVVDDDDEDEDEEEEDSDDEEEALAGAGVEVEMIPDLLRGQNSPDKKMEMSNNTNEIKHGRWRIWHIRPRRPGQVRAPNYMLCSETVALASNKACILEPPRWHIYVITLLPDLTQIRRVLSTLRACRPGKSPMARSHTGLVGNRRR